jgi:hypothetical protein
MLSCLFRFSKALLLHFSGAPASRYNRAPTEIPEWPNQETVSRRPTGSTGGGQTRTFVFLFCWCRARQGRWGQLAAARLQSALSSHFAKERHCESPSEQDPNASQGRCEASCQNSVESQSNAQGRSPGQEKSNQSGCQQSRQGERQAFKQGSARAFARLGSQQKISRSTRSGQSQGGGQIHSTRPTRGTTCGKTIANT